MKMAPEDVLEEFIANADIYESGRGDGKVIAECEDFDVQIILSGQHCKTFGPGVYPGITVIASGEVIFDDFAEDEDELVEMLNEVYDKYLTTKIIDEITGESAKAPAEEPSRPPDDPDLRAEEIELREKELDCAVEDFLFIVYGEDVTLDMPNGSEILEKLKDALLEKCAEIVDENIYRPTVFEDPDDPEKEVFEEFPYAEETT